MLHAALHLENVCYALNLQHYFEYYLVLLLKRVLIFICADLIQSLRLIGK